MSDREIPEECDFCHFKTEVKLYSRPLSEDAYLCLVCASTLAGNAHRYPDQYQNVPIMKQISFCTNLILSRLPASPTNEENQ
jgi:hypothetical protein